MKLFTKLFVPALLSVIMFASGSINGQDAWKYVQKISFPKADSGKVSPYLCTLDSRGRLYVISSRVADANAHNAIYWADSTDTEFTKMVDFTELHDTLNVHQIIGLTTIKNDVVISTSMHRTINPGGVSHVYIFPNGDPAQKLEYGFNSPAGNSGWGTFVYGITATKDSILFAGIPFGGTSIRAYNFSRKFAGAAYSLFINMDGVTPQEPGGANNVGFDIIRDCAVIPGADYNNPETVWYTSRNSDKSNPNITGGIARWAGGTEFAPKNYVGQRVSDANLDLSFGPALPYGITVDAQARLWVAGIDTNRTWVKCFTDNMGDATEEFQLPGKFSKSEPDTAGAPMTYPADVAVTADIKTAYVIDAGSDAAYMFKFVTTVGVKDEKKVTPENFILEQNYPNPFNPSTSISYTLPKGMNIRLVVTNAIGQEIATLADGFQTAGKHVASFNASKLTSGVYFYTLKGENMLLSKKMMLMK